MPNHILITGASGNLGSEVVKKLYESGYGICATVGSGEVPQEMAAMLLDARQVDLTDEAATQSYVEEITRHHPELRAAVLLVGGFGMGSIAETTGAMLDKQINLNFKTAFFVAKPLLKHFEQRGGGQIILVGSRPAILPKAGKDMVAYALSKSLLFRLAEFINEAGKGKHITASVIVPSTIDTQANRQNMPDTDFSKWIKAGDIADTIAFLLSDAGSILRETVLKVYNES
jgi:NAD(P)-dependent dehydrogenase (short-subunit alcohol dehydrogenase family)